MPAKTTELEAVNTILSTVGEPPIVSLTGQQNADATIARNILGEISREVQAQGWHFNTLYDQTLTPDSSGHIQLAEEVVRVDNSPVVPGSFTPNGATLGSDERDVVQRGDRLFDKTNNTYVFSSNVRATLVYLYDFEELPEPARRYITVRSARVFQDRMVGSQKAHMYTVQDEARALAVMKEFEGDTADRTIFDHYDVAKAVNRRSGIRSGGY